MELTTYDEIYEQFLSINKTNPITLPTETQKIYKCINNAVKMYNNRTRDTIKCNDTIEQVDRKLNDDELLIIAHYIKLEFLGNELTYFVSIYDGFQKEIGIKNYRDTVSSKRQLVESTKNDIEELLRNQQEDFL